MAAYGLDHGTRDLDVFLSADPENVTRLRKALSSVYHDPAIEDITAEDLGGHDPAVQYGPPDVDFTIDLVTRLGEAFAFSGLEVQRLTLGEVEIAVVTPQALYDMKRDTVPPARRRRCGPAAARLRPGGLSVSIRRFRTVADIPDPSGAASPLEGLAAACTASELSKAFGHEAVAPRGVRKFRSIEAASDHRRAWEDAAMQRPQGAAEA